MVDIADLDTIRFLDSQLENCERLVALIDAGDGGITQLIWTPAAPGPGAVISTIGWPYPAQMVDAIKQLTTTRIDELRKELAELGVTGGVSARTAPSPIRPAPTSRGARK